MFLRLQGKDIIQEFQYQHQQHIRKPQQYHHRGIHCFRLSSQLIIIQKG